MKRTLQISGELYDVWKEVQKLEYIAELYAYAGKDDRMENYASSFCEASGKLMEAIEKSYPELKGKVWSLTETGYVIC